MDSGLMPNCTGAESVHASMRRCQDRRKIGLLEACETDQNRAVLQISAYTGYLEGVHRGKGPTIWELALRSTDSIGSPKAYEEATNLLLTSTVKYDLFRSEPLNGDFRTKSVKRKGGGPTTISAQDSHRHDQILMTEAVKPTLKKRNLFSTEFSNLPTEEDLPEPGPQIVDLSDDSPICSSDDVQVLRTPRPRTRSSTSSPILGASSTKAGVVQSVSERQIIPGSWHLRRSSKSGPGPVCNGSLKISTSGRSECRNNLKIVGFKNREGVVGVAVQGF